MTMGSLTRAVSTGLGAAAGGPVILIQQRKGDSFMRRQAIPHDKSMKRTAINLLQVSAAYFALGSVAMPGLAQPTGFKAHPPLFTHRLAAGAWPMLGLPTPTPRKRTGRSNEYPHLLQAAANDEKV
jgi:hypothetical protein